MSVKGPFIPQDSLLASLGHFFMGTLDLEREDFTADESIDIEVETESPSDVTYAYQTSDTQDKLTRISRLYQNLANSTTNTETKFSISNAFNRLLAPFYFNESVESAWFNELIINRWFDYLSMMNSAVANISSLVATSAENIRNGRCDYLEKMKLGQRNEDKQRLLSKSILLWPFEYGNHWYVITISKQQNDDILISCSDGLNRLHNHDYFLTLADNLLKALFSKEEYASLNIIKQKRKIPFQNNAYDCGPAICCEASRQINLPIADNYSESRLHIANQIARFFPTPEGFCARTLYAQKESSSIQSQDVIVIEDDERPTRQRQKLFSTTY